MNLRLLRRFIRRRDAREVRDLARASLLVKALRIPPLRLLDRDVDEYFDEGDRVVAALTGAFVQIARDLAVRDVGRDEGGEGDGGGVCEELCYLFSLASAFMFSLPSRIRSSD